MNPFFLIESTRTVRNHHGMVNSGRLLSPAASSRRYKGAN